MLKEAVIEWQKKNHESRGWWLSVANDPDKLNACNSYHESLLTFILLSL